ncbi:hybrid sensor histidine kinase/response regulator [Chroococcidiopsis sp. FACHB-1243]|uniref:hybrid sensor histidine kinase/response regulator n=1 Tax=Chroococcidiopsis sp. [FACHB-1243] TaxID=2692781 RepID=UPI00177B94D9|nr:hybrid sensor histidine kinase/response regulator [Chroococcidiopsis sp. [FACHB-1243]]MBD2304351.1 hybrid sensor histidine kinase/response regulator [Chroococcidiopsis sp. [FACHB-1243]]
MNDSLHEQSYAYFLQEAPQLLQILEEELLNLKTEWSMNKVHTLMRATHTLKGSAACVGLDSIRQLAHSFEDIFRHLCRPEVTLDRETEALLFEAYDCLRIPLMAEITGSHSQDAEVFDRAAAVFSELQAKLGVHFAPEVEIPNSDELGFDVTKSIFEVGVAQRLAEIDRALVAGDVEAIAIALQTQAEVFLGLAESLNLPGFGAIASAAIVALANYPDKAITIAQIALADFQQGQASILAGDRSGGGSPSAQLLELVKGAGSREQGAGEKRAEEAEEAEGVGGEKPRTTHLSFPTPDSRLPTPEDEDSLLESIWTIAEPVEDEEAEPSETVTTAINTNSERSVSPPSSLAKRDAAMSDTVRVNVGHLERLNYSIGELLTNQNRQTLQDEKLQGGMQGLLELIQQQQQMLMELKQRLDLQEKDRSSKLAVLVQSLLANGAQLQATGDEIDIYTRQSSQMLEKQSRLLNSVRDEFLTARVIPVSVVFDRLPPILRQLETLHDKSVALEFSGKEVLIDKAVAEKLYDPLLHLVRNAFDHGIEPKPKRSQLGKASTGRIAIRAFHQGSHLTIEIQDDGQGLNYDRIRQRALEMGLVSPVDASSLSEVQLMDFIFEPGFSTAAQVNNLSGRGVGLDVVRAQLQSLQGAIAVYSQPQRGTTFILQIPLSLTIAKLFLCQVGSTTYALLGSAIEQILLPQPEQLRPWRGGKVLRWGEANAEQLIPVLPLKGILPYFAPLTSPANSSTALQGRIVLLRYQDQLIAVEIDHAIGEQELVIRPLDPMIVPPSYVYGGSILADGKLTLAIDSTALAKYVLERQVTQGMGQVRSDRDSSLLNSVTPMLSIPQLQSEPSAVGAKILLVDDSLTWRQTLALTLQQAGYQVVQADNGREAMTQLRSHPDFGAIVCDLEMPEMNGLELLHYCRQSSSCAQMPFVILTANTDAENRTAAMELGATDYINKSRSHQELLATVAQLVR